MMVVYGEINVMGTESGDRLRILLGNDFELSVYSRATGTVENGIVIIDKLIAFDYIVSPVPKLENRRKKINRILNKINNG